MAEDFIFSTGLWRARPLEISSRCGHRLESTPMEEATTPQTVSAEPVEATGSIGPVAAKDRIEVIDVLRGAALFGILAANIRGFAGPAPAYFQPSLMWPEMWDRLAQAFIDAFIQGKFITIFALLFGVGFGVQLSRAKDKHVSFGGFYSRRLLILMGFGLIHGLYIWFGDILLPYACVGFILFMFRNRKDKTIAAWSVVLYVLPLVLMMAGVAAQYAKGEAFPVPPPPTQAELQRSVEIFSEGTIAEIHVERTHDVVAYNWGFFPFFVTQLTSLFLAGMLAWRKGFFQPSEESIPGYRKAMVWGYAIGIPGNLGLVVVTWVYELSPFELSLPQLILGVVRTVAIPALSLGYICTIILLTRDPRWHDRLARFGAVGRIALTNYLMQAIIGTLIFYSFGLGLFGSMGPAILLVLTIVFFAAQVWFSGWWLDRFRFGPFEWLWRSLTYGKMQEMRKT